MNAALAKARGTDEVKSLYRDIVTANHLFAHKNSNDPNMPTTDITDTAIVDAVTNPYPKTRYLVGPDSWMLYYLSNYILSDRVFDSMFHWFMYKGGYKYG